MASKGKQSNVPRERAKARTVASSRKQPANKPQAGRYCRTCGYDLKNLGARGECPECGCCFPPFTDRPHLTTPQTRRAQLLTIGLTLILLAIPTVIAAFRLSDAVPSRQAPELFPPWYSLGALLAIAVVWVNYVIWLRRKTGQV